MKNAISLACLVLLASLTGISCEILSPPYFNLAENRRIVATATCGDQGVREEYCQFNDRYAVVFGSPDKPRCEFCDLSDPVLSTAPQNAIDGTERMWQSPPLSRGAKYASVNLTIDLGQEFDVAYVFITMGNSSRPAVWALEKSSDFGRTWTTWQYFARSKEHCMKYFGTMETSVTADDSVICDTIFARNLPLRNGEVIVSLLYGRPSATDYFHSPALQQWTKATNVRLRLMKTAINLMEEDGALRQKFPLPKWLYKYFFYSIKDISLGGRCHCNGHADLCDITDPVDPYKLSCRCQHNTCGGQCEHCCPGHFRSSGNLVDKCEKCDCSAEGSVGEVCDNKTGQCICREGFTGRRCAERLPTYVVDAPAADKVDDKPKVVNVLARGRFPFGQSILLGRLILNNNRI